jgi:CRP-like cAMP-binding protein
LDSDNRPVNCAFYYLGKGTCKVKVKDNLGQVKCVRNLSDGDHFGEVAVLYKCRRSATVISMNYNTFAVM